MVRALIRTGFLLLLAGLLVLPAMAGAGSGKRLGVVQGQLVELHRDVIGGEPLPGFGLSDGVLSQTLSADQPRELLGQQVAVEDTSNRAGLQGAAEPTSGTRELVASPPGPHTTAVVLVNFTAPANTTPVTVEAIKSTVFTADESANQFFQQQSGGAVSLIGLDDPSGDVFGWWTLDMPKPTCADDQTSNPVITNAEMNQIITKARAYDGTVGVNLDSYEYVSFYFPTNTACHWAGLGVLTGGYSWINGYNDTRVFAHELGHNMGVHHAASLNCGTSTITADPYSTRPDFDPAHPSANQRTDGCSYTEYGDWYDVMGYSTALMSAWHRAQLEQLPEDARMTVTTSGPVTLDAVNNSAADDPRLLLVPRRVGFAPVSEYFAVELRSAFGDFDVIETLLSDQVGGLTIRLVPLLSEVQPSQLLNMHPAVNSDFDASALQPGETFTDPLSDVQIRNDGTGAGTASLTVTVPELDTTPPSAPAVSVVAGASGPEVSWTAASDNVGVDHYEVRRNGVAIAQTPSDTLSYTDSGAHGRAHAEYRVAAVDAAANSTVSASVGIDLPDVTAPLMAALSAERRANGDVALTFSGTDDRAVDHYAVSWDSGGAIVTGNQWVYTGAPAAATSYVVRAVDAAGNSSNAMTVSVGPFTAGDPTDAAKPTTLAPLPRLLVTRGRGGRVVITVSGATRITVTSLGWRASVAGARLSRTLPAKVRRARRAQLNVRAVVGGKTLRATLTVRRGVVSVR